MKDIKTPNQHVWHVDFTRIQFESGSALRSLALLLFFAFPAAMHAQFNYTVNYGQIIITKYIGSDDVVSVPSTINGLPVVGIGPNSFAFPPNPHVTRVSIPDGVTSIGSRAFFGCTTLTSVTI